MATDPYVREVGYVADMRGAQAFVGIDYDTVTVRTGLTGIMLTRDGVEEFARLFVAACWEAGENAKHMRDDTAPLPELPDVCQGAAATPSRDRLPPTGKGGRPWLLSTAPCGAPAKNATATDTAATTKSHPATSTPST